LKILCPSLAAFQELMDTMLEAELGVDRYMTYIGTREVKSTPPNLAKLAAGSLVPTIPTDRARKP